MPTRKKAQRQQDGPKDARPRLRAPAAKGKCKYCWGEVLWFKRPDGRIHPPVVSVGTVLIATGEDGDIIEEAEALVRHQCDPDDVDYVTRTKAEQAERAESRIAAAREQVAVRKVTSTLAEQAHKMALAVECPACTAKVGERCLNLNKVMGRGKDPASLPTHTKWPHPDRVLLADG